MVSQTLRQIHQITGDRPVRVETGRDHLCGVAVPQPGRGAPPQHVFDPPELVASGPADLGFGPDQAGFCFGVLHVRVPVPAAVHHVGGPVVPDNTGEGKQAMQEACSHTRTPLGTLLGEATVVRNWRGVAIVGCGSGGVAVDHETFLEREPVFTRSDLASYLDGQGVAHPRAAAGRLGERWQQEGRVVMVRPDVYAVVNGGRDPARFQPMPDLVATKMAPDAVVSHHSALDYWGISYSMWFDAVYSATDPPPSMVYGAMYYRGVRFPERLIESGHQHFGVVEETYAGGTVRVTTMERTLVDILANPDLGGSWDEIWQSVARADSIDVETVATYCELVDGGAALRAKVGFFLDQHRDEWGIDDRALAPFRPPPRSAPFHLDPAHHPRCRFVPEWNLMAPIEVLERQWELVF